MQDNKSTDFLQSELKHASSLEKFIQENEKNFKEKSVSEYLIEMLIKYDIEKSDVVHRAGLPGTYAYQIFDSKKSAGREKLIRLTFGFPLNFEETQRLLHFGGHNELYVKKKREALVMYALEKGYDLNKVNELLYQNGEAPLE